MGAEDRGAQQHEEDDHAHGDHVLARGGREEGNAVLLDFFFVLRSVGLAVDEPTWHRPLVDAESEDQPQMHAYETDQKARYCEDVKGEKARKRSPGDDGPT